MVRVLKTAYIHTDVRHTLLRVWNPGALTPAYPRPLRDGGALREGSGCTRAHLFMQMRDI
jgi:hypothetical protein